MPTLFDHFGRPIEAKAARRPEPREISTVSLRDRWGTYPSHGLTPERLASIFKEADLGDVSRQAELFMEMEEKDGHMASQFQLRKLAVQGLEWEIEPGADDPRAEAAADFCREILEGLTDLDELLLDLLDAVAKGYSLAEILWDVSSGQAGIREVRWIMPNKVTWWESVVPRLLTEAEPVRGEDLVPFKFIYHKYKARSGMDTRAGVLRTCAWMYLFKNYSVKDWVAFSEIYGQPMRYGVYDPSAGQDERAALLAAVRAIGTDAAGIISRGTEIKLLEGQRYGSLNVYETLVRFCDEQMSKAILGQTLTSEASGQDGSGSRALGEVHADVRRDLLEADAKALGKSLRQQLLRPLVGFNFGWEVATPWLRFVVEEPEDMRQVAETIKVAGEFLDISQEWASERLGMPLRQQNETPLKTAAAASPEAAQALKQVAAKGETPPAPETPEPQHPADLITGRLAEATAEPLDAWVNQVRELLDSSADLTEFRDRLVDLFAGLDPADMASAMAEAFALAELAGRFDG